MRAVTSLSCGIWHRESPAEARAPADLVGRISRVVEPLIEDCLDTGAMVTPFDGEVFAAHWNALMVEPEHALHACEAATRMCATLVEVNAQLNRAYRFDSEPFAPIEIGIGIATGNTVAGGFSSGGRLSFALIGRTPPFAGHIRSISAKYGFPVVADEATYQEANRDFAFLEIDFLTFDPGERPARLYAVLGNAAMRASPKFRALTTFHEHIFQSLRAKEWDQARAFIAQARKLSGASRTLYDFHLGRISWYESHPPEPDWDAAFRPPIT
jgi:adenylate cyclase